MTENLLLKLEEKVITLLSELENLRNEVKQLRVENQSLKTDRMTSTDRLKELITQLDELSWVPSSPANINEHELFPGKTACVSE